MERENLIEKYLVSEVNKIGGLCLKWVSPGNRGVPDRIVIVGGQVFFVELKASRGVLSPLQEGWLNKLTRVGADALVISSKQEVDVVIVLLKKYIESLKGHPNMRDLILKGGDK